MTVRMHRDAVIAELEKSLPGSVFKSYSASGQSRYAVVFIAAASRPRTRFTGPQSRTIYTVTVHSVGSDEDQALWVQERVDGLTGARLSVPGFRVWPVEFITSQPAQLDDDGTRPLWYTVSQFDITSDPL